MTLSTLKLHMNAIKYLHYASSTSLSFSCALQEFGRWKAAKMKLFRVRNPFPKSWIILWFSSEPIPREWRHAGADPRDGGRGRGVRKAQGWPNEPSSMFPPQTQCRVWPKLPPRALLLPEVPGCCYGFLLGVQRTVVVACNFLFSPLNSAKNLQGLISILCPPKWAFYSLCKASVGNTAPQRETYI